MGKGSCGMGGISAVHPELVSDAVVPPGSDGSGTGGGASGTGVGSFGAGRDGGCWPGLEAHRVVLNCPDCLESKAMRTTSTNEEMKMRIFLVPPFRESPSPVISAFRLPVASRLAEI